MKMTFLYTVPSLPSLPFLPVSSFPTPHHSNHPVPLEVSPLNEAKRMGSAVRSPNGVWGGVPAEIDFDAF